MLFADVRASLVAQGYTHLEPRIPEGAEEALAFWDAQGFAATGERDVSGCYSVVTLAREIYEIKETCRWDEPPSFCIVLSTTSIC